MTYSIGVCCELVDTQVTLLRISGYANHFVRNRALLNTPCSAGRHTDAVALLLEGDLGIHESTKEPSSIRHLLALLLEADLRMHWSTKEPYSIRHSACAKWRIEYGSFVDRKWRIEYGSFVERIQYVTSHRRSDVLNTALLRISAYASPLPAGAPISDVLNSAVSNTSLCTGVLNKRAVLNTLLSTRGGVLGSSTIREVGGWGRVPFSRI